VKASLKRVFFWLRIVAPVVLLAIIFSRVDLPRLLATLKGVHLDLAIYSLVIGYLVPMFLCAWRWQMALRVLYGIRASYSFLLKHYWIGTFVGYLVPGGVGADIYRVTCTARREGGFQLNAATVIGEKLFAVVANGLMLMLAYPLVANAISAPPEVMPVIRGVYTMGAIALVILALVLLAGSGAGQRLRKAIEARFRRKIDRVTHDASPTTAGNSSGVVEAIRPFFLARNQLLIVAVTALNQVIASYGGRLLMLSVGVDLSLTVHVFVWTLMFFIFLLPISVGTLGVREGTYIVVFGLFGVEDEEALAGSFVGLASLLFTVGLGGLVWLAEARGSARAERGPKRSLP
jgi:glycosyltransferase 2 family protein